MKVLVLGGCGFIGSHIVDVLLEQGFEVRVLDRNQERFRPKPANVELVLGDVTDTSLVAEALSGIDAVVHAASSTVPSTSNLDPVSDITTNLVPTVRLLSTMRSIGVQRLVFLSSGGTVYGTPDTDPVPETHTLRPISSYGIVKAAIENYIFMEAQLGALNAVVLRPSNPYGPRQGHRGVQGVIGTFLWKAYRGEPIEVWGDGSIVRDFVYVRDLAELCVAALKSPSSGIFNAGSGEGHSIENIVAAVQQAIGRDLKIVRKSGRRFDVPRVVLDTSKARREFAWAPTVGLADGIAETWKWVRTVNV